MSRNDYSVRLSDWCSGSLESKGQFMITKLLKWKVGSEVVEARIAELVFVVAACLIPAAVGLELIKMQLTSWQFLVGLVAAACLGFQFLILGLLCRVLRQKTGAA
jgi:hypothetical protein